MGKGKGAFVRCLPVLGLLVSAPQSAVAGNGAAISFPVPTVRIQTGDVLNDDLLIERRLIANRVALRTHFTSRDQVVGKVARRPLAAGAAIPMNALREPYAFNEGDRVVAEFISGGLRIRGMAIALQPGVVGSSVRLRNADTGTIVNGVVQPDGRVEVGG
ncbi:MAG: flagellar basal body P-ring formation chaperone FlgA [Hyphomicrobiaceae bacterium]|uniref:flagellar basal body P-ring formation chaperone FlgA n=1 Tax=Pseudorhodoplanes sp. TaxID=1934341 RepID=UPI003D13F244